VARRQRWHAGVVRRLEGAGAAACDLRCREAHTGPGHPHSAGLHVGRIGIHQYGGAGVVEPGHAVARLRARGTRGTQGRVQEALGIGARDQHHALLAGRRRVGQRNDQVEHRAALGYAVGHIELGHDRPDCATCLLGLALELRCPGNRLARREQRGAAGTDDAQPAVIVAPQDVFQHCVQQRGGIRLATAHAAHGVGEHGVARGMLEAPVSIGDPEFDLAGGERGGIGELGLGTLAHLLDLRPVHAVAEGEHAQGAGQEHQSGPPRQVAGELVRGSLRAPGLRDVQQHGGKGDEDDAHEHPDPGVRMSLRAAVRPRVGPHDPGEAGHQVHERQDET
jgi:hypothetical protein